MSSVSEYIQCQVSVGTAGVMCQRVQLVSCVNEKSQCRVSMSTASVMCQ